ncbi:hypothetical protein CYLTODRAFT_397691 [Cylindrobasidium torrendii FP15055 ss-10]|uniref:PH domain-containing protein n=1 Tax=Cylindrobasidium torrendii FP15055 ss-10 TaxID=1314674 RepID=A0A0D7BC70_9AGAR|nr:hypothetical protein CYLTODRAFT_397691 [Cylindrobasidium torrendii FP15055 ss-10]
MADPTRRPPARTLSGLSGRSYSSSELKQVQEEYHVHRRWFIGPMPEKVVLPNQEEITRRQKIAALAKQHALSFFLDRGGNLEDWTDDKERSVREEMVQKWREGEWGELLNRHKSAKKKQANGTVWIGNSFEVGDFVGVNVLAAQSAEALLGGVSSRNGMAPTFLDADKPIFSEPDSMRASQDTRNAVSVADTFVTARESMQEASSTIPQAQTELPPTPVAFTPDPASAMASSTTNLIEPPARPELQSSLSRTVRPIVKAQSTSQLVQKRVHYADMDSVSDVHDVTPPDEVLERTGSEVEDTSAGSMSTEAASIDEGAAWGDIILRDRMLVRVAHTHLDSLGVNFNDQKHRTTTGLQFDAWGEFMAVWRQDHLELYEDYSTPGKERLLQHKHLAFVVPLQSANTKLCMYSFVDMTFCLTCKPSSTRGKESKTARFRRFFTTDDTYVFVCKVKTRSRALDWIWQLWRHIGGQLPKILEVRSPILDTKVKIDVPTIETVDGLKMFTRSNIIKLCIQGLRTVPDWHDVVEHQICGGRVLELAWRSGVNLDWIWQEEDVFNRDRSWVVLCGLALQQAHLEIRLGDHYPNKVSNPNTKHDDELSDQFMSEPSAVEGYVTRIKPATHQRQPFYLATHDGYLFVLPPSKASPPSPFLSDDDDIAPGETQGQTLKDREVARGEAHVWNASGVNDLRNILLVRRAETTVVPERHDMPSVKHDDEAHWATIWAAGVPSEEGDYDDEGGEEYVSKVEDKPLLRMKRSFELFLTSGRVVRFECHSCKHAVEWVERLRALVAYWTLRHKEDAKDEMEVASAERPRLTPLLHVHVTDEELPPQPPPDPAAALPSLTKMYNWCVLQGCKSILRCGKLHMRRGLRGQYKTVQMFLVSGALVMFRVKPGTQLYPAMKKRVSLQDAYTCSGYFAALTLPSGQYDPEKNSVPRRYGDGLETDDQEEDTLFMICYRRPQANGTVPSLATKHKSVLYRTRSKLERDTWCWAINCEIERVVRRQRDYEAALRDTGGFVKL